jgi:peroxiredoxin
MRKIIPSTVFLILCLFKGFSISNDFGLVILNGHVEGRVDSVIVKFYKDFLYNLMDAYSFKAPIDAAGNFHFQMDSVDHPAKMEFEIFGEQTVVYEGFVSEPGDSISFLIDNRGLKARYVFSGRGASKYQCVMETIQFHEIAESLWVQRVNPKDKHYLNVFEPKNVPKMFAIVHENMESELRILDLYKSQINPTVQRLMAADIRGYYNTIWESHLYLFLRLAKTGKQKDTARQIADRFDIPVDTSSAYVKSLSRLYITFLIEKSSNKLYYKYTDFSFRQLYFQVRSDYSGILREKALMYCLLNPGYRYDSNTSSYDSCLQDGYRLITNYYLKNAIGRELTAFKKGTPAHDFSFPDTAGKLITLSGLKGNVILLDIWGTGCSECVKFARNFDRYVQPFIPEDSPFVYLSIDADVTKERWMSSLKKGIYSPKKCIEVYTGGMGDNDPMQLYYEVQYNPFVLLIDKKGRIYAKISTGGSLEELKTIILDALHEN